MNIPVKSQSLQSYQVVLYDRVLHPELFALRDRRTIRHGQYEFEAWLMPGSHLMRFEHNSFRCSELVTDQDENLPELGVVTTFLCAGERDYEHTFEDHSVKYMAMAQTETLSENLYEATYRELYEHGVEHDAMVYEWVEDGPNLSVLAVQRLSREIHAQSYHLRAQGGLVLRTQTIFEHLPA